MGTKVSIDGLADAVMQGLNEYQALTNEGVKAAVKKAGDTAGMDTEAILKAALKQMAFM